MKPVWRMLKKVPWVRASLSLLIGIVVWLAVRWSDQCRVVFEAKEENRSYEFKLNGNILLIRDTKFDRLKFNQSNDNVFLFRALDITKGQVINEISLKNNYTEAVCDSEGCLYAISRFLNTPNDIDNASATLMKLRPGDKECIVIRRWNQDDNLRYSFCFSKDRQHVMVAEIRTGSFSVQKATDHEKTFETYETSTGKLVGQIKLPWGFISQMFPLTNRIGFLLLADPMFENQSKGRITSSEFKSTAYFLDEKLKPIQEPMKEIPVVMSSHIELWNDRYLSISGRGPGVFVDLESREKKNLLESDKFPANVFDDFHPVVSWDQNHDLSFYSNRFSFPTKGKPIHFVFDHVTKEKRYFDDADLAATSNTRPSLQVHGWLPHSHSVLVHYDDNQSNNPAIRLYDWVKDKWENNTTPSKNYRTIGLFEIHTKKATPWIQYGKNWNDIKTMPTADGESILMLLSDIRDGLRIELRDNPLRSNNMMRGGPSGVLAALACFLLLNWPFKVRRLPPKPLPEAAA